MRILNWNAEWASPRSLRGRGIREELTRRDPDIICLTEASREMLPPDGAVLESEADYGYGVKRWRRKVLLWSRSGFDASTTCSPPGMPGGRFVAGVVKGSGVYFVGVCIPWWGAHVTTGRRDRERWQDHLAYLLALRSTLEAANERKVVVLGDFNQTVPRSRAPQNVYDQLLRTFEGFSIVTAAQPSSPEVIDHMAATPGVELESLAYLPQLSDHLGWIAEVNFP